MCRLFTAIKLQRTPPIPHSEFERQLSEVSPERFNDPQAEYSRNRMLSRIRRLSRQCPSLWHQQVLLETYLWVCNDQDQEFWSGLGRFGHYQAYGAYPTYGDVLEMIKARLPKTRLERVLYWLESWFR